MCISKESDELDDNMINGQSTQLNRHTILRSGFPGHCRWQTKLKHITERYKQKYIHKEHGPRHGVVRPPSRVCKTSNRHISRSQAQAAKRIEYMARRLCWTW